MEETGCSSVRSAALGGLEGSLRITGMSPHTPGPHPDTGFLPSAGHPSSAGQHQDVEADSQGPSHDRKLTWRLCFTSSTSESGLPAISLLRWPTGPGQADRLTVQALKVEKDALCTPGWRLAAAWSQMKCCYRLSMFKYLAGTVSFGSQLSSVTGLITQRIKRGTISLPPPKPSVG